MSERKTRGGSRAGFTLIEIMAVLMILAILAGFLLINLRSAEDTMEINLTRTRTSRA